MNVKVLVLGLLILTSAIFVDELNIPFLSQVDVQSKKTVEITDMQIDREPGSNRVEVLVEYKKIGEVEPGGNGDDPHYIGMSGVAPNGYRYHLTAQNAADMDFYNLVNEDQLTQSLANNNNLVPWVPDNRYLMIMEVGYTVDGRDTCADIQRASGNDGDWGEFDKEQIAIEVVDNEIRQTRQFVTVDLPDNIMDYQLTACAYVYQTVDAGNEEYSMFDYHLRSKVKSVTKEYSLPDGTLVALAARTCNENTASHCNNLGSAIIKDPDGNEIGRNENVNVEVRKEYTLEAIPTGSNEFKHWQCKDGCLHFDEDERIQESEEITITVRGKQTWVAYFTQNAAVTNTVTITPIITLNEEFGTISPNVPTEVVAGEQYTVTITPKEEYKNRQETQWVIPFINSVEFDPSRGSTTDIDLVEYGFDDRCNGFIASGGYPDVDGLDCGPTKTISINFIADVDTVVNVEFKSFGRQLEPEGCDGADCPAQPIECRDAAVAGYIDKCSVPPTATNNDNGNIPQEGISSLSKNNLALIGGLVTAFGLFGNGFLPRRLR